jgi:hypothetical protein
MGWLQSRIALRSGAVTGALQSGADTGVALVAGARHCGFNRLMPC